MPHPGPGFRPQKDWQAPRLLGTLAGRVMSDMSKLTGSCKRIRRHLEIFTGIRRNHGIATDRDTPGIPGNGNPEECTTPAASCTELYCK